MEDRERRIARNEAMFREVNERIEELNTVFGQMAGTMTVICECGDAQCVEQIDLELAVYEGARADPALFVIAPGHEILDIEDVVSEAEFYTVVKKHPGEPRRTARATDSRS